MFESTSIDTAIDALLESRYTTVFTGAGISVESGIPAFRGEDGLWATHDPAILEIGSFFSNPVSCWESIKEIFYNYYDSALPNSAHKAIGRLEELGFVKKVITQNIDDLHQKGGSKNVIEFHGTLNRLKCISCDVSIEYKRELIEKLPPLCNTCHSVLKPEFVFFGEQIPEIASRLSVEETGRAELFLVIGTTGEVQPASQIPFLAKSNGAKIIEINVKPSRLTHVITDHFIQGRATDVLSAIVNRIEQIL